jgi:hypothetical protein
MYPVDLSSTEVQVTWRATLLKGSPWSSRHFGMAVIFNLLNVIQLAVMYKYRDRTGLFEPYLSLFFLAVVFMYATLDYYAVSLYRQTHDWLKSLPEESAESQTLLRLSYVGYRLYIMGLGIGFFIFAFCNMIIRQSGTR